MSQPNAEETQKLSQLRLLRALDDAAAKLEAAERDRSEPIAIIGVGCRYPGGVTDAASFWRLLRDGTDAIREVPSDRWDAAAWYDADPDAPGRICTRSGGFLDEVDRFDAAHFGLSPREAVAMDPQQRLLLEVAHEALESAGQLGDRLAANATGVFVGLTHNDYATLLEQAAAGRPLDQYFITGNSPNAAAGRVSYLLGLRGPSLVIDTACSSSLVSVHLACQSLRAGDCRLALAGGVNLILRPEGSVALSRAHMLARDGRCKSFDAAADGYGRGEGCGLVVLKRLSAARCDGDRILAVIRGSATNQDGPTSGFTVPNGAAQRALLRTALEHARLGPGEIDLLEAHGTGTALGDPVELNALGEVLGEGRPRDRPLLVGSVKTNFGHCESAAGIAGLIKAALAVWHGEIPAHLHFRTPSPHIPWEDLLVEIAARHRPWPAVDRPRRAGVSAFGVSGTNAHIILEQAPAEHAAKELPVPRRHFRGERHWVELPAAVPTGAAPDGGDLAVALQRLTQRGTLTPEEARLAPKLLAALGAEKKQAEEAARWSRWFYEGVWKSSPRRERDVSPVAFTAPADLAVQMGAWFKSAGPHPGGAEYARLMPRLEALSRRFARTAIEAVAPEQVVPAHRRLFARLQALAAEAAPGADDPAQEAIRLEAACPEAHAEITLLARCGARLPDVLRGACDPLTLLFPADEAVTAADLYQHTPFARRANELVAAVLGRLGPTSGPLRRRILEIGAGTGGTTAAVLPALDPAGTDYVFTDVSPAFVAQAQRRFPAWPNLRGRLLDIERDPRSQGFATGEFDVVLAANVLHATRDLGATLRHVRSLLAEGGRLVLLEATEPLGYLDLIFGLTDGWWRFADAELRPAHPLLPAARWHQALGEAGFAAPEAFSFPAADGEIFAKQSVITAVAAGRPAADRPAAGAWLVLGEKSEFIETLMRSLTKAGGQCVVGPWTGGRMPEVPAAAGGAWRGVVYGGGLDRVDPLDGEPLRGLLAAAQALAARPAPLWLVTRGAVATGPGDLAAGTGRADLWGFARTLAQEHPELKAVRVDLDPASAPGDGVARLLPELLAPDGEDQIAWRGMERRVARMTPADLTAGQPPAFRADATYLIVGGLGGLGRPLARWFGKRGARHLVLMGRSAAAGAAAELIDELAKTGVTVRIEAGDVARETDLKRVLAVIAASGFPLRGVVHAAGVLDDGVVRQLTWERVARVLAPKVTGAWHLHQLTRGLPLDCFVLFSTATALLGSPGQANHAAANAFLDSLAASRRAAGLPALSINWGAWAEIGAAADRGVGERLRPKGIGTIAPDEGWRALDFLWNQAAAQVAVLPVDWAQVPASLVAPAFFAEVRSTAASAGATTVTDWTGLVPVERRGRLLAEVRRQVAAVLGLAGESAVDPDRGFFTLGMDSLTAVELRNRLQTALGVPVASTAVFDYPTPEMLAAFLAERNGTAAGAQPSSPVPAAPVAPTPRAASAATEPIAVVGIGCRFPGGVDSPESYWNLLAAGVDAVGAVPSERWSLDDFYDPDPEARGKMYVREGGFLAAVDGFDAAFFGVAPREAVAMDPQQRLLLEVSWEALENAGCAPDSLKASRTGVFVGISNHDYTERLLAAGPAEMDSYVGSGNAHSVAAGRLSYTLGLQGPCLAVDTACSSSLVAVHLACQSLRQGECTLALAGGVNLLLSPTISLNHSRARMLSPDGRCKTFSADADGFGRADGCGVVVLKRLADAQRDGDRVLGVVRGSAVNQDGRTSGLTVPSGPSQQAVIRAALDQAGATPDAVGYVEAHGTGTSLGDPIEMGALAAVFGPGRKTDQPLFVGSVKTNFGHCESAAGVAGLIKAVLAVGRGEIPAHLHFDRPNPHIPWNELPWVRIPGRASAWPADRPRVAGVSSFGFGGTNAHVVVAAPPAEPARPVTPRPGEVFVLAARTEKALGELAGRYVSSLRSGALPDWPEVCRTAATGRAALPHRLALLASDAGDATAKLERFVQGGAPGADVWQGESTGRPRVAFLFSGQGSLYAGMGRELAATCPAYREAFEECREIVRKHAGWDLAEAIEAEARLALTEFGQVALFAVEYALSRTWMEWGVMPAAVVGHSVGEYAAACAAGRLPVDVALPLLITRARLMGALGDCGTMLAVSGTEADVTGVLVRHGLEIAGHNSPRQIVLTGDSAAIAAAKDELQAAGRRAQSLEVRQAYHSRLMEPMLGEFERTAAAILGPVAAMPADGGTKFVSTLSGAAVTDELRTAEYWTRQIRRPVRFAAAMEALRGEDIDVLIEVGPRGVLAALGQQTWPAGTGEWLLSLRPGRGDWAQVLESAGRAWVRGAPVSWPAVNRGFAWTRASLPTYPFQRQRYWCDEPAKPVSVADTYELKWEPAELSAAAPAAPGVWQITGGSTVLQRRLQQVLAARDQTVVERSGARVTGVIFLADQTAAKADPAAAAALACERLRVLVQRLLKRKSVPRLWLVTRGAMPAGQTGNEAVALAATTLWGFGQALTLEHPEMFGGMVDLPAKTESGEVERLADELLARSPEDRVAFRAGTRLVARLHPTVVPAGRVRIRADGAYLITGGLGALGLEVAGWLAEQGARSLVLAGRRAPNAAAEAAVARLTAAGVKVAVRSLDTADPAAVRRLVAEFGRVLPPLRGLVHAAGVAGYDAVESIDAAGLAAVLRPKVAAAWALHRATVAVPLDFFVLFSSIASAWGSKGQAHYAAANQFLDGLAHHRRALGLPALSVNWGPWDSTGGMATAEAKALLGRSGVQPLVPAAALAALGAALAAGRTQLVVARVDWNVFKPGFESRRPRPLLAHVGGTTTVPAAPKKSAMRDELAGLAGAKRLERLRACVSDVVAAVLRLPADERPAPRRGFNEMGVDSLMAVEIRNRLAADLGLELPATLAFNHPDVERLSSHLLTLLGGPDEPGPVPAPAVAVPTELTPAATRDRVERMSEEEAEAELLKKLQQL